jgi:SNF2 family DNA or RNA helicase
MSVIDRFVRPVTEQDRAAGLDLHQSGSVRIQTAGPGWLTAVVKTGDHQHRATLTWGDSPVMGFFCTCQTGQTHAICPHVLATALSADAEGRLAPHARPEADSARDKETLPRRGAHRPAMWLSGTGQLRRADVDDPRPVIEHRPSPPSWKKQLQKVKEAASFPARPTPEGWPTDRQILYIIDAAASSECNALVVKLACRDRRQTGEWTRPRTRGITFPDLAALGDPDDCQIMALLRGASQTFHHTYDPVYAVPAAMRPMLVERMCRTGRTMLRHDSDDELTPLTWNDGSPWQLSLQASPDHATQQYRFTGYLVCDDQRMPTSRPVLLLDGGVVFYADKAAAVEDHGQLVWLPILRQHRAITVPFSQANELLAELLSMPNLPNLDLPDDLRVEETRVSPRFVLRVRAPDRDEHRPERLRAELSFDYDGARVPFDHESSRTVFQPQPRRLIVRDQPAEREGVARLGRLGVREAFNYSKARREFWFSQKHLARLVRTLVSEGWQVEADGKLYRRAGNLRLRVSSGVDWFGLSGDIDFEGHTIKLPALLRALRRGEKTVRLDDGTLGVLPEHWLKKYALIAAVGDTEDDFVKFPKSQAALLDALLTTHEDATCDEAFQKVRDQLQTFAGVHPQDPPHTFIGTLRPYQRDGLGWFDFLRQFSFGGCLADDMGLGKTVQVLALLEQRRTLRQSEIENQKSKIRHTPSPSSSLPTDNVQSAITPSLVVVPKSLVFNWIAEAHRFTPKLRFLDHTGIERARHGQPLMDYDVVITTYGTLRRDVEFLKDIQFDYVVLDEAQAVKNPASESAKAVRLVKGNHRLALSGTPVQNHLGDLWSVFDFLNPGMLGSASIFIDSQSSLRNPDPDARLVLSKALRPFILRRTKEQVASDLPPRLEQTLYCELDESQRKLYNELREYYRASLLQRIDRDGLAKSKMHILEALLRLRQAALHPGLIDPSRTAEPSAKLSVLLPQLEEVIDEGHKALVFSQFTSMLAILRAQLDKKKIRYEYLDGKTRDRAARVEHFQNDEHCKLFLISLKAGGLGLNLTAADYVFLLDPWWNPAVEQQAIDRTHRIGQTRRVYACRLIAKDTVEEKVVSLQQNKRQLADAIITADNSLIRSLGRQELEMLLA